MKAYETPFFIWANAVALKTTNFSENAKNIKMPVNDIISSFYLGTTVMELLDMGNISPLFGFVNELRGSLPVASSNVYMYPDGTLSDTIDESKTADIQKYKEWIYYKLFDDEISTP